jgi:hypothetical protein
MHADLDHQATLPFYFTIPGSVSAGRPFSLCLRVERCFRPLPSFQVDLLVFIEDNRIRLPVQNDSLLNDCEPFIAYARFNIPSLAPGRYEITYNQFFPPNLTTVPPLITQVFNFDLLEPVSVPALSKWGNVALLGLVFGLGTLTVWRRH